MLGNRIVLKYPIKALPREDFPIEMPSGSKILKAGIQRRTVMIWVEADLDMPMETRVFKIVGTGTQAIVNEPHGQIDCHIETIFEGEFVWHIYEVRRGDRS